MRTFLLVVTAVALAACSPDSSALIGVEGDDSVVNVDSARSAVTAQADCSLPCAPGDFCGSDGACHPKSPQAFTLDLRSQDLTEISGRILEAGRTPTLNCWSAGPELTIALRGTKSSRMIGVNCINRFTFHAFVPKDVYEVSINDAFDLRQTVWSWPEGQYWEPELKVGTLDATGDSVRVDYDVAAKIQISGRVLRDGKLPDGACVHGSSPGVVRISDDRYSRGIIAPLRCEKGQLRFTAQTFPGRWKLFVDGPWVPYSSAFTKMGRAQFHELAFAERELDANSGEVELNFSTVDIHGALLAGGRPLSETLNCASEGGAASWMNLVFDDVDRVNSFQFTLPCPGASHTFALPVLPGRYNVSLEASPFAGAPKRMPRSLLGSVDARRDGEVLIDFPLARTNVRALVDGAAANGVLSLESPVDSTVTARMYGEQASRVSALPGRYLAKFVRSDGREFRHADVELRGGSVDIEFGSPVTTRVQLRFNGEPFPVFPSCEYYAAHFIIYDRAQGIDVRKNLLCGDAQSGFDVALPPGHYSVSMLLNRELQARFGWTSDWYDFENAIDVPSSGVAHLEIKTRGVSGTLKIAGRAPRIAPTCNGLFVGQSLGGFRSNLRFECEEGQVRLRGVARVGRNSGYIWSSDVSIPEWVRAEDTTFEVAPAPVE